MFGFGAKDDKDVAGEEPAKVQPAVEEPAKAPEHSDEPEQEQEPAVPHNVEPSESAVEPPVDNKPAEPVGGEAAVEAESEKGAEKPLEPTAPEATPPLVPEGAPGVDNPATLPADEDGKLKEDDAKSDAKADSTPGTAPSLPGTGVPPPPEEQPPADKPPLQAEPQAAPDEGPAIEPTKEEPVEVHPAEDAVAGVKPPTIIPNDSPSVQEFKDAIVKLKDLAAGLANKDTPYRGVVLEVLTFATNIAGKVEAMDGPGIAGA